MTLLLLLLLLACTSKDPGDTAPAVDSSPPGHTGVVDSGPGPDGGGQDTAPPDVPEGLCDGRDEDGDGVVDDGYPDSDGDGRADCMQCAVEDKAGALEVGETACTVDWTPSDDPWNVELWWEWALPEGNPEGYGCTVTAAGDVDGDGVVEILCQGELLYIVDGASGLLQARVEGYLWSSAHALYDHDRDGTLDIAGLTEDGETLIVDGFGRELHRSGHLLEPVNRDARIVADFHLVDVEGDGTVSALNHRGWQEVESGDIRALFYGVDENDYLYQSALPIEVDGALATFTYYSRYDSDGTVQWAPSLPVYRGPDPVPVQDPTDGGLRIAWTGLFDTELNIVEPDGRVAASIEPAPDGATVAGGCGGDFDGDGALDLAVAQGVNLQPEQATIVAFRGDGTTIWSEALVYEPGGGGWCSVADLNGDGLPEVFAIDFYTLSIFDGSSGTAVYRHTVPEGQGTGTISELPLAIDLDGDGSVELVEPNSFPIDTSPTPTVLRVFRHALAQWPPGAPFWASSSWSGTQLQTNGTIPRRPRKAWETTKLWRGMPTTWIAGGDLQVEVVDACAAEAAQLDPPTPEAEVRLAVRVSNLGPEEANTGVRLTVTGTDADGGPLTLATETWDFLYTGEATATVEVVTTRDVADRGLHLLAEHLVDGALTVQDCDPGNHDWTWTPADL